MAYCTNCGFTLQGGTKFCQQCGAAITNSGAQTGYYQPQYLQQERPAPVATGGLLAWSVTILILCMNTDAALAVIPVIVALVKVNSINQKGTYAEQQAAVQSTKTWNIVGTVLAVLLLLISIVEA